jgi:hypothetical protein
MAMRGNQPTTTQEAPQSSFAMTILPGTAPARLRKERAPKDKAPAQPKEPKQPKEAKLPREPKQLREPKLPKEPRAPRFTLRAHKDAPPVHVAALVELAHSVEEAESPETAEPVEMAAPVEMAVPVETPPPAIETWSPPPPPAQFSPAPAQFSPPPPPAQFSPPPPPAEFTAAPPQFTPTADPFAHLSPPPVHEEPAVQGWYAPVDTSAAPEAPAADYPPPTAYPMAPGYPAQPQYADQSHFGYPQQAEPQSQPPFDPQHFAGNPNLSTFAPHPPPVGSWVPQHAAPGAGISSSGRSSASKALIGIAIAVAGIIVLGILAAMAISVFGNHHHHPTVARLALLPDTLVDQQKIVSPEFSSDTTSQIAQLRHAIPDVLQANAAYYGQGGLPVFSVAAGNLYPSPTAADAKAFFGTAAGAGSISFTPVGSGPFGGWMECGGSTVNVNGSPMTTCASLDNAAVVIVSAANTTPSQLAILTRQIISSVEMKG